VKLPRWSLRALIILIALFGIGAASLLNASRFWAGVIPMLTTTLLLASILGVIYRRGESRAGWIGFAVFGWGFVLLSLFGSSAKIALVDPSQQARLLLRWFAYTRDLGPVVGQFSDVRRAGSFEPAMVLERFPNGGYHVQFEDGRKTGATIDQFRRNNEEFYLDVGNSMCVVGFALIGSMISNVLYSTRSKLETHSVPPKPK
jgi:hypothetical protein